MKTRGWWSTLWIRPNRRWNLPSASKKEGRWSQPAASIRCNVDQSDAGWRYTVERFVRTLAAGRPSRYSGTRKLFFQPCGLEHNQGYWRDTLFRGELLGKTQQYRGAWNHRHSRFSNCYRRPSGGAAYRLSCRGGRHLRRHVSETGESVLFAFFVDGQRLRSSNEARQRSRYRARCFAGSSAD